MDIKHGDIITLDNGDTVKVSLEVIKQKVKKLKQGSRYILGKEGGQYCHYVNKSVESGNLELSSDIEFIYVGKITIFPGDRHIFYSPSPWGYAMYGTDNLDFVIKELN